MIYRDLKLENILMNEDGYIKLIDFGISKQLDIKARERTFSIRGTPEYLAPEILLKKGYSFEVDWWALGTIAYELLAGQPPFFDEKETQMYVKIVKAKLQFPELDPPLSEECCDFIDRLLAKDPLKRLGAQGQDEVLQHPFLAALDLDLLKMKVLEAPYVPQVGDDVFDVSNFEQELTNHKSFEDRRLSVQKADLIKARAGSIFKRL